jgi:hypothetical protein
MTSLARTFVLAAALAAPAANLAVAETPHDDDETEEARLTIVEGSFHGDRVRFLAGELDGKGVAYVEHYGPSGGLKLTNGFADVMVDGEETNVRNLEKVVATGTNEHGFTFTAYQGNTRLRCIALMYADLTVTCSRNPAWTPPGAAMCAKHFKGKTTRFQCNGLVEHVPGKPHEEALNICVAAFRNEMDREDCMRFGIHHPIDLFRDTIAACTAAYKTEDERDYCVFYSFAPANPKDRPSIDLVRKCDRLHDDDRETSYCVFDNHTGVKQMREKRPGWTFTEPVAHNTKSRLRGARLEVAMGKYDQVDLRATGGIIDGEAVIYIDALAGGHKLEYTNPIPNLKVGKKLYAVRAATSLDRVKYNGHLLTFRVTLNGKRMECRNESAFTSAICR